MIHFPRLLARQLLAVLKKAFASPRDRPAAWRFRSGADGLRIQAHTSSQAVEYHDPEPQDPYDWLVPLSLLDDVEGTRPELVTLSQLNEQTLSGAWQDRGVLHELEYPLPAPDPRASSFPDSPERWSNNPPSLIAALRDASPICDLESSRYALSCLRLCGAKGQVAATDGRQLLLQTGFQFPFAGQVLVPRPSILRCKEFSTGEPVQVGKTDQHLVLRVGRWTFWLAIDALGRFPRVDDVVPRAADATTTLELSAEDRKFLRIYERSLPWEAEHRSLTLDLNGRIALRAQTPVMPVPTELVLRSSRRTGQDLQIVLDRFQFLRAADLGLSQFCFFGPDKPLLAQNQTRQYVSMPFAAALAIPPHDACRRLESPLPPDVRLHSPPPSQETKPAMPSRTTEPNQTATSLDQALTTRDALRSSLVAVQQLIRTLREERKRQRTAKTASRRQRLAAAA